MTMPLPNKPFKIEGGCNCGAVRYRVTVPAKDNRPIYPGYGEAVNPPVRMPFSCTDHCNDCRGATGALLPTWLLTPMRMVEASLAKVTLVANDGKLDRVAEREEWKAASDIFCAAQAPPNSSLAFFASSEGRRRSFCRRCGTMMAYQVFPKLEFLDFEMLDIVLGTIDRADLEKVELRPERQLHWQRGIKWVQDLSTDGLKVPRHADWSVASQAVRQ